jgi:hypothetical protein
VLYDYDDALVDSVVDLRLSRTAIVRRIEAESRRAARAGLELSVVRRHMLGAEHLYLIDEWAGGHSVSPFHVTFAAAVANYVSAPPIHLIEARLKGELMGFAVVSVASLRRAVVLQLFAQRRAGVRIDDALYAATLRFVDERGVDALHLGYSASPSLLRFKRKWHATRNCPPYREAGYTADPVLFAAMIEQKATWQQRLTAKSRIDPSHAVSA